MMAFVGDDDCTLRKVNCRLPAGDPNIGARGNGRVKGEGFEGLVALLVRVGQPSNLRPARFALDGPAFQDAIQRR